jgi:hypothetical protein
MKTYCLFRAITRLWSSDRQVSSDSGKIIGGRTPKNFAEKEYTPARVVLHEFYWEPQTGVIF